MSLSLKEPRAATETAKVIYTFLLGSCAVGLKGHVIFATVDFNDGVGNFWTGGSKEPAIAQLLELKLEYRRDCFELLILGTWNNSSRGVTPARLGLLLSEKDIH